MKKEVFYGKGMGKLKEEDEDLYQAIVALNDAVWNAPCLNASLKVSNICHVLATMKATENRYIPIYTFNSSLFNAVFVFWRFYKNFFKKLH